MSVERITSASLLQSLAIATGTTPKRFEGTSTFRSHIQFTNNTGVTLYVLCLSTRYTAAQMLTGAASVPYISTTVFLQAIPHNPFVVTAILCPKTINGEVDVWFVHADAGTATLQVQEINKEEL